MAVTATFALVLFLSYYSQSLPVENEIGTTPLPPPPVALSLHPPASMIIKTGQGELLKSNNELSCSRNASTCIHLPNATCLGSKLSYDLVSLDLTNAESIWDAKKQLKFWTRLQSVPECWPLMHALLCSVFMPPCYQKNTSSSAFLLDSVPHKLCRVTEGPCRIVREFKEWPDFLHCNNTDTFSNTCDERRRDHTASSQSFLRLNVSQGKCPWPLVATGRENAFFEPFDGCGMQCQAPLFTKDEYLNMNGKIVFMGSIGSLLFAFVILTHVLAGWKNVHIYPNVIIFFMSINLLAIMFGFLLQYFPGVKRDVTCEEDGTLRVHGTSGSASMCTASFFLLYYNFLSLCIWFVIMIYCWYVGDSEAIEKKKSYFHMLAWPVPFVPSLIITAFNLIEADSLMGVCFVTSRNLTARIIFFILPLLLTIIVSAVFSYLYFKRFLPVLEWKQTLLAHKMATCSSLVKRLGFSALIWTCCGFLIIFDIYQLSYQEEWDNTLRKLVFCQVESLSLDQNERAYYKCKMRSSPNIYMNYVALGCLVVPAISVFLWTFEGDSAGEIWKKAFMRCCGRRSKDEDNDGHHMGKKHKIIMQAYKERSKLKQTGRLSISLPSLTGPALGGSAMNIKQETSAEFDTSFVCAMPRLVNRRNAIDIHSQSDASNLNAAGLVVSVSRRHSFDSQLSIQPTELEHLRSLYKNGKKRSKRKFFGSKDRKSRRRRLSITSNGTTSAYSNDSSTASQILPAVTMDHTLIDSLMSRTSSLNRIPSFLRRGPGGTDNGIELQDLRSKGKHSDKVSEISMIELLERLRDKNLTDNEVTDGPSIKLVDSSVQTSVTNLDNTCIQTPKVSVAIQCDDSQVSTPIPYSTTTSSSQTESQPLRHIEPNVIRISVPNNDRSSGDSSYDQDLHTSTKLLLSSNQKENSRRFELPDVKPAIREIHHRGRRGGISLSEELEIVNRNPLDTSSTS